MNNLFNLRRFSRLFIKHTIEHYKSYLMALLVLTGVMLLGGTFLIFMIPGLMDIGFQSAAFMFILLLAGTIFTSTVFGDLGDRKKAIASLTLPASHLEKYIVVWIYSFVVFLLLFTGSFYLIMLFLINIERVPGQIPEVFNIFQNHFGGQILLLFGLLHAIAFYGAIFFEKLHFIKTAFAFFITIASLVFLNKIFQSALINKDVMPNTPFAGIRFMQNSRYVAVNLDSIQADRVLYLVVVITFIFWIAAYYRLKEKQV